MWNDVFKVSSSRINMLQLLLLKWRPQPLVVNGWGANGRPGGGKNIQFFGWLWSDLVIHVSFSNAPNFQKSKKQVFWIWPTLLRSFPLTYVFHGRTGSWYKIIISIYVFYLHDPSTIYFMCQRFSDFFQLPALPETPQGTAKGKATSKNSALIASRFHDDFVSIIWGFGGCKWKTPKRWWIFLRGKIECRY